MHMCVCIFMYIHKLEKCYELMKIAIAGGVCKNAVIQKHIIKKTH